MDYLRKLFGGPRRREADIGGGAHAETVLAHPPVDLLTNENGEKRRLRVDIGETQFFTGRQFRTFRRLSFQNSATLVIRCVTPINMIIHRLSVHLIDGQAEVVTKVGGTAGGTFSETLPIIPRNSMSERPTPFYESVMVITAGGTHTGGTELDVMEVKSLKTTESSGSVGVGIGDERGIAAGTYYFVVNVTGATTGVLEAAWEERP